MTSLLTVMHSQKNVDILSKKLIKVGIHFFKEPAFKYHQYLIVKVKKCLAGSIVLAMAEHHCAINVVMR